MSIAYCEERITYWRAAAANAEEQWLKHEGSPWEKERLRRAYEFTNKLVLGWERERDATQLRLAVRPRLRLVRTG